MADAERRKDNAESRKDKARKVMEEVVTVSPPRMCILTQPIVFTSPYMQGRFPEKARQMMQDKQEAGSTAKKGGKREARDFDADYQNSMHRGPRGEYGIPAAAFRAAAVSACRTVNFKMTLAKLGLFVEADFLDPRDGTPLVALEGEPRPCTLPVRNTNGVADLRCRALWQECRATVRIRYDADMFRLEDVVNLLARIGAQVGIGEGRADSKKSAGIGYGFFKLDGAGSVEEVRFVDTPAPAAA
jgi:hypothetical protein